MNKSYFDWKVFWIRFVCSFLFFGFVTAILVLRAIGIEDVNLMSAAMVWFIATSAMSLFTAKVGDEGWHKLISFFRWWV